MEMYWKKDKRSGEQERSGMVLGTDRDLRGFLFRHVTCDGVKEWEEEKGELKRNKPQQDCTKGGQRHWTIW
jgi:hypothetical protein